MLTGEPMIVDRTAECYDGRGTRLDAARVRLVIVHRLHLRALGVRDEDLDGPRVVEAFRDRALGTGGRPPYHLLVRPSGLVEQMLPLDVRGAHAIGINAFSLAVAVVGDPRFVAPTPAQLGALTSLCVLLARYGEPLLEIEGHTERPGRTQYQGHDCPGRLLDLARLRADVAARLPGSVCIEDGAALLARAGVRLV